MEFGELRDNLYSVLVDGDFTMEYPSVRFDSVRDRYSFRTRLGNKPNFRLTIGGNVSSTPFNQIYLGIDYQAVGRTAQQFDLDLYLGPLYTWGTVGGRTDFYMRYPVFLEYSYVFSTSNYGHGSFGRLTKVDNIQSVKEGQSFLTLGAGIPLTRRSVLMVHANGGRINYRYESERQPADDTDQTRFNFLGVKAEVARNTLDKFLYPRRGTDLSFSLVYVRGLDKFRPFETHRFTQKRTRQWFGGRFFVGRLFRHPGVPLVLARVRHRRRSHDAARLHHRCRDPHGDAGLRPGLPRADDLHARFPGPAVHRRRSHAHFRPSCPTSSSARASTPCTANGTTSPRSPAARTDSGTTSPRLRWSTIRPSDP